MGLVNFRDISHISLISDAGKADKKTREPIKYPVSNNNVGSGAPSGLRTIAPYLAASQEAGSRG